MKNRQPGFIKFIVLVIVILVILSVMGVNLKGVVESPMVQDNFNYVWHYVMIAYNYLLGIWQTYILPNLTTFWEWFKVNNHVPNINPIPPSQA